MTFGIRTNSPSGVLQLAPDRRLLRFVQSFSVPSITMYQVFYGDVLGLRNDGQWIIDCQTYPNAVKIFNDRFEMFFYGGKLSGSAGTPFSINVFRW